MKVHFADIFVNFSHGDREAIINVGEKAYSIPFEKLPEKYKILYVAWLRLHKYDVPEDLKEFIRSDIDISNLFVDIDLGEAVKL